MWQVINLHCDLGFEKSAMSYKTGGLSWGLWFDEHEQYIGIITDREHLKKCIDCKDIWESVAKNMFVYISPHIYRKIYNHI